MNHIEHVCVPNEIHRESIFLRRIGLPVGVYGNNNKFHEIHTYPAREGTREPFAVTRNAPIVIAVPTTNNVPTTNHWCHSDYTYKDELA